MNVLVGCEDSGVVREAFRRRGHNAWSCDLNPAVDGSPFHLQMDLNLVLYYPMRVLGGMPRWMQQVEWDLGIFHPTCTTMCNSSVWAFTKTPPNPSPGVLYGAARWRAMEAAVDFTKRLWECGIPKVAIENPVMHRYARERFGVKPSQTVQPYQFGDDASKRTCLWLRGLPTLAIPPEAQWVAPRVVDGKPRWGNQTDSGQNKFGPSTDRWKARAKTYTGIAEAMAAQWGGAA